MLFENVMKMSIWKCTKESFRKLHALKTELATLEVFSLKGVLTETTSTKKHFGCWKSFSKAGFEAICSNQCQINPSALNSCKTKIIRKKFLPLILWPPSPFYHTIFILAISIDRSFPKAGHTKCEEFSKSAQRDGSKKDQKLLNVRKCLETFERSICL